MIVTKIERQKNNPDRYSLFIDGDFALGVRSAALARAGLRRGDDVSPAALEELKADDERAGARAAAIRFAGRRRRTEHEIRVKLTSLEYSPAASDDALGSLRESGLADDRAYVRAFIHDAQLQRPAGARLLAQRLRGKGIPPDILREEIAAAFGPEDEAALAERCAAPYLAKLVRRGDAGKAFRPGEKASLLRRYLSGRGFSATAVEGAVKSAFGPGAAGG